MPGRPHHRRRPVRPRHRSWPPPRRRHQHRRPRHPPSRPGRCVGEFCSDVRAPHPENAERHRIRPPKPIRQSLVHRPPRRSRMAAHHPDPPPGLDGLPSLVPRHPRPACRERHHRHQHPPRPHKPNRRGRHLNRHALGPHRRASHRLRGRRHLAHPRGHHRQPAPRPLRPRLHANRFPTIRRPAHPARSPP